MTATVADDLGLRRAGLLAGCAGLVTAAAFWVDSPGYPAGGASGEAVRRHVEESFDALTWAVAGQLVGVGAVLVLVAALNSLLRPAETPRRFWSDLAIVCGAVVAVWLTLQASLDAIPLVLADDDGTLAAYDDGTLLALEPIGRLGETFGDVAGIPRGLLVLAVSVLALRTRLLPRWLGYVGLVVAAASLVSVAVPAFGLFAFGLWLPVLSVVLLVRAARGTLAVPLAAPGRGPTDQE
ncbi:DUF4386 family protein [Georgenia subflava]|nr:DUF4386 family protein [Georgenia subflava]